MRSSILLAAMASLLVAASCLQASPLLQTTWEQRDEYAMYAPNQWRLGCWSTALAQILYHHRLAPHGSNSYTCTNGTYVSANFDSHVFDWRLFVNRIDPGTPAASAQEVALYSYFTSVVIEKDFNTGDYMLGHSARAAALEDHYDCDTAVYSLGWFYDMDDLKADIAAEITAGRPLMLHMRDTSDNYHAVAIDDYRIVGSTFEVHINMGWEGSHDGYYDIAGAIYTYNDASYRKIITVRPPDTPPPVPWPVANNDAYSGNEDNAIDIDVPGVLANDVDDDPMTAVKLSNPAHGTVTLDTDGSFLYTPQDNYYGTDSFTYRAFNGQLYSDPAAVNLDVVSVNDAPTAVDDAYTCPQNSTIIKYAYEGVLINDDDADNHDFDTGHTDTLTTSPGTGPSHGSLTWYGGGSFKYTPTYGYAGVDSFTYKTYDGEAYSDLATVLVTVLAPIPGDANGDRKVDATDAAAVAQNWGKPAAGASKGNFNGDGFCGAADAAILAANWGDHTGERSAVPEPSSVAPLAVGLLALCLRRASSRLDG